MLERYEVVWRLPGMALYVRSIWDRVCVGPDFLALGASHSNRSEMGVVRSQELQCRRCARKGPLSRELGRHCLRQWRSQMMMPTTQRHPTRLNCGHGLRTVSVGRADWVFPRV
jgi:hypothetical protein